MKTIIGAILIALMPTVALSQASVGQVNKLVLCGKSDIVLKKLKEFGETDFDFVGFTQKSDGKPNKEMAVGIFKNKKTGSFSIVETHVNGISCVISTGYDAESTIKKDTPKL
jgi:hypothetical protein